MLKPKCLRWTKRLYSRAHTIVLYTKFDMKTWSLVHITKPKQSQVDFGRKKKEKLNASERLRWGSCTKWRRSCTFKRKKKIVHVLRTNWTFTNSFNKFISNNAKLESMIFFLASEIEEWQCEDTKLCSWKKKRDVFCSTFSYLLVSHSGYTECKVCFFFFNKPTKQKHERSRLESTLQQCTEDQKTRKPKRRLHQRTLWHRFPVNPTTIYD